MTNGTVTIDAECDEDECGKDFANMFQKTEYFAGGSAEHPEAENLVDDCHRKRQHGEKIDYAENTDVGESRVVSRTVVVCLDCLLTDSVQN